MSYSELLNKLHRTWVQALIDDYWADYAAMIVDAELSYRLDHDYGEECIGEIFVYLPLSSYSLLKKDEEGQKVLVDKFRFIGQGHIWYNMENFPVNFRVKLMDVEEDWQKTIKYLIAQSKDLNQAVISEKVRTREEREPAVYTYNEMKFASKSEIRIAQELEQAGVLFFPLPMAVRHETGKLYLDHREVDFLVCVDGIWGVLEVAYHVHRYEKDKEKDAWLKKSGILCIEHFTAERCYNAPKAVVAEFLEHLAKYKK
jgi:hypothetical protein